jgi:hypothetical protein
MNMSEPQGRGYILAATYSFLREQAGEEKTAQVVSELSDELQAILPALKPAGWYPVRVFGELNRAVVATLAGDDEGKAREVLLNCGRFMGREASNTFLRLLMKMLTPNLLAKKIPEFWKRDFSEGQVEITVTETNLVGRISPVETHSHIGPISAGWCAFNLETMGKTIDQTKLTDWSLAEPAKSGVTFEFIWQK